MLLAIMSLHSCLLQVIFSVICLYYDKYSTVHAAASVINQTQRYHTQCIMRTMKPKGQSYAENINYL